MRSPGRVFNLLSLMALSLLGQLLVLDGNFRLTNGVGIDRAIRTMLEIENQPVGIVGEWIDAQTFIIDYDTLTNRYRYRMQMHFNGNDVALNLSERVYGDQISFSGHMQTP